MINRRGKLKALRFHGAAGLHVDEVKGQRVVVRGGGAAGSERENLETGGVRVRAGGVEMNTDKDGILRRVRDPGADFERDEDVILTGHDDLEAFGLQHRAQLARDIERIRLLVAVSAGRAFVETAVAGIEHHGGDFAAALDHVGPELGLDGFGKVDARDEEFVVLGDDGEAEPVADAVHDGFAAVEGELELVAAVIENDGPAGSVDVADEAVKLRNVVGAQIIAGADFDDLPILIRGRRSLRGRGGGGFGGRLGGGFRGLRRGFGFGPERDGAEAKAECTREEEQG